MSHRQVGMNRTILASLVLMPGASLALWCVYRNAKIEVTRSSDTCRVPFCKGSSGVLIKQEQFWLPKELLGKHSKLQQIHEFVVRNDDVVVASFPKSGTTWVQEIVYCILHDENDRQKNTIEERFPYLEYIYPGLKSLAKASSPRYIKTHLPYTMLPMGLGNGTGKVIYIARNPKDVSVSYYHFIKMLTITAYKGEFKDFFNSFLEGKVAYGPWSDHVLQYWNHRHNENMLFIKYEDLHKNPVIVIQKIGRFLGKVLDDRTSLEIAYRCSFTQMKSNPASNYEWWDELGIRDTSKAHFLRRGKIGDWVNYYTPSMIQQMNELCAKSVDKHGLVLHYE